MPRVEIEKLGFKYILWKYTIKCTCGLSFQHNYLISVQLNFISDGAGKSQKQVTKIAWGALQIHKSALYILFLFVLQISSVIYSIIVKWMWGVRD